MSLKESEIQSQVKQYLTLKGWYVVKIHQSLGSFKGIADLYCLKGGRSVWLEIKTLKGRQSEEQKEFEASIKHHGGEYYVIRDLNNVLNL